MSFAVARILAGIVLVTAVAAAVPEPALAQSCNSGSIALGGIQPFSFQLDPTQMAQFTLDGQATDLAMTVVDDQGNVACQTALSTGNHLSCSWMPADGAAYTLQVMRPASPDAVAAAAASAGASGAAATPVSDTVNAGDGNGLGGPTEDFNLCSQATQ